MARPGAAQASAGIDDYAGAVIDLMDALHIESAMIGGLSMGGYVTFAVHRRAPTYFAGMLLANTRAQADSDEGRAGRLKMIDLVSVEGAPGVARQMLPKLLGEDTRNERSEIVRKVEQLILAAPPDAIVAALRAMMSRPDSTSGSQSRDLSHTRGVRRSRHTHSAGREPFHATEDSLGPSGGPLGGGASFEHGAAAGVQPGALPVSHGPSVRYVRLPAWMAVAGLLCLLTGGTPTLAIQDQEPVIAVDPIHARFERILDTYVRDGLVYYRALKAERRVLDNYLAHLARPRRLRRLRSGPRRLSRRSG